MSLSGPPYRQSLIAAFDPCPRKAFYYLTEDSGSQIAAAGTLFHRGLEAAVREMRVSGSNAIGEEHVFGLLSRALAQADVPAGDRLSIGLKDVARTRRIAEKFASFASRPDSPLDPALVVDQERRLHADVALPSGDVVGVTGQMDVVQADPPSGVRCIDWKTGWKRPAPARGDDGTGGISELGWVQARVYALLTFSKYPSAETFEFVEVAVMWGEWRTFRTTRAESEEFRAPLAVQLSLLHDAVREGAASPAWKANPGTHCAWCPGRRDCEAAQAVGVPDCEDDARKLAQEWILRAEKQKDARGRLGAWVEANGPIEVPSSNGRKAVGWDVAADGKRFFGTFSPDDQFDEFFGVQVPGKDRW